jgi:hypothetical protein
VRPSTRCRGRRAGSTEAARGAVRFRVPLPQLGVWFAHFATRCNGPPASSRCLPLGGRVGRPGGCVGPSFAESRQGEVAAYLAAAVPNRTLAIGRSARHRVAGDDVGRASANRGARGHRSGVAGARTRLRSRSRRPRLARCARGRSGVRSVEPQR